MVDKPHLAHLLFNYMENPLTRFIELVKMSFVSKKVVGILSVAILFAAIPLTVFIAQQQQDIRQRASGSPQITSGPSANPRTFTAGEASRIDVCASGNSDTDYILVQLYKLGVEGPQATIGSTWDAGNNTCDNEPWEARAEGNYLLRFTPYKGGVAGPNRDLEPIRVNAARRCAQVLTPARNSSSGECRIFSDSCLPSGWTYDSSCDNQPTPTLPVAPTATPVPTAGPTATVAPTATGVPSGGTQTLGCGVNVPPANENCRSTYAVGGKFYWCGGVPGSSLGCIAGKSPSAGYTCQADGRWVGAEDELTCTSECFDPVNRCQPGGSPTSAPTASAGLALDLGLGIGINKTIGTPQRNIIVELYNSTDQLVGTAITQTNAVRYNSATGRFTGNVNLPNVAAGAYTVKIKTNRYLRKRLPNIITVTGSTQTITVPQVTLVAGDATNNNILDVGDYSMLVGCFGPKASTAACGANKINADLNDDGSVDEFDYNVLIRNFSIRNGD